MKIAEIKLVNNYKGVNLSYNDPKWAGCEEILLNEVRVESKGSLPLTRVKLSACSEGINGIFKIEDSSILARYKRDQEPVWRDSCVEIYLKPGNVKGYMNFEFNCIGTLLCSYITNHERTEDGFKEWRFVADEDCEAVGRKTSLSESYAEEVEFGKEWYLEFFIPLSMLKKYFGEIEIAEGEEWYCNLYKCGDDLQNPHWISWSPVRELNFHNPDDFGKIKFIQSFIS
ncbi:MAG: carbohydrate-binding family 9-like protein [Ignavibacteriaceae bacterium]|jgi:hypothetical protein|nr:carbohydrate-binding family 9-like protein [Ignavibacteriaceae bacterium]